MAKIHGGLRNGYTTGTCAAAAAKAATVCLLGEKMKPAVEIVLPSGETLDVKIEEWQKGFNSITCGVKKDSGDDPDVTNGVLVYATVEKTDAEGIKIDGGLGIGRVTKRGLSVPVGEAAINPVPRSMIKNEVSKIIQEYGYDGGLKIVISIPAGVELAKRTFNPRLGIEGGISVLGTTGIVHPMSEQAWIDAMRVEMNVLYENVGEMIALTPGNYGETFLTQTLNVNKRYVSKCSNFVGDAITFVNEIGFSKVLLCGHIGKFIKLAGGMTNLHSKYGDCRMELLAASAAAEGAGRILACKILDCVVVDDVLDLLDEEGLLEQTMTRVTDRIWFHVKNRFDENTLTGLVVFSSVRGVLGKAGAAQVLVGQMQTRDKEEEGKHD